LSGFPAQNLLINETIKAAILLADLAGMVFPGIAREAADRAVDALLRSEYAETNMNEEVAVR